MPEVTNDDLEFLRDLGVADFVLSLVTNEVARNIWREMIRSEEEFHLPPRTDADREVATKFVERRLAAHA